MKLGLLARAERRGLGHMTREFYEHMHPDRTLVVLPIGVKARGLTSHLGWYPEAAVVRYDGALDEQVVRPWLAGLDALYSAETLYDWRLADWAREAGVRTVCHIMPEYFRHSGPKPPPAPDVWWTPTRWRLSFLPTSTRVVPVPIATERFAPLNESLNHSSPLRWLHTAGARAAADRNGTRVVLSSLQHLVRAHEIRIRAQDEYIARARVGPKVRVEVHTAETENYWELYDDVSALVLPRRYAGLSLPALEGMGAGLALVMPDVEPQASEWPIIGLPAVSRGTIQTGAGPIPLAEVAPRKLAARMDWLADHPDEVVSAQKRSRAFAAEHSWHELEPVIRGELERACC